MLKKAFYYLAAAVLLIGAASAQEIKSEFSVQGTGFFTKNSDGQGIRNQATETGGVLVYRYNINRWLAAEADYGYARNTQSFFGSTPARIQANVHEITGSAVVKLPGIARLQPFALVGGGALVFDPTNNLGGSFLVQPGKPREHFSMAPEQTMSSRNTFPSALNTEAWCTKHRGSTSLL